ESFGVSAGMRDLIASMLQKKVADRPRSARELLERIDEILKASSPPSRSASKRITALVIDHEPESLAFLTRVLQGEGYRVLATGNAREGIDIAIEQTPAIIFLDARIRGGFDLPVEAAGEEA